MGEREEDPPKNGTHENPDLEMRICLEYIISNDDKPLYTLYRLNNSSTLCQPLAIVRQKVLNARPELITRPSTLIQ